MSASDGFVSLSNEDGYNQFICLRRSVMGIGAYADHQVIRPTQHLKEPELKKIPPNHIRRQANLRGFRERCLLNLNLTPRRAKPYIVAYSDSVSADFLPLAIPGIQLVKLSPVEPWRQQIGVTSKASILVQELRLCSFQKEPLLLLSEKRRKTGIRGATMRFFDCTW